MIVKYLGTKVSEGIPVIFCPCEVCQYARINKGNNIRTKYQGLIDGERLLDFRPDTFLHSLEYNIELADIEVCLITHSHDVYMYLRELGVGK